MVNFEDWSDAFDSQITKGTTNEADIAAHYRYSPERLRVSVDGTRQFIQYGDISQYNDIVDGHQLIPGQGETVTFTTAEQYRYVVGYVIEPSMAYEFSRSLETGDKAVIGYGDADLTNDMANADGWFFIYTPEIGDTEVIVAEYRNGTEVDSETVSCEKALTIWKRMAIRLNWYNVGEAKYIETYTENGNQINAEQGKTSVDNDKGPELGNQPVTFSVTRGASSSALTLTAGSIGVQTFGDVTSILRAKTARTEVDLGTANSWEPIAALRVDPDRNIVSTQLDVLQPVSYSADSDILLMAIAVDPSKTDASGFTTPQEHNATNSVVEETTTVSTLPDNTGSVVSNATNTGGYQVGYGSLTTTGQGSKSETSAIGRTTKRTIPRDNVVIIAGYSGSTGTVTFEYRTEQDW